MIRDQVGHRYLQRQLGLAVVVAVYGCLLQPLSSLLSLGVQVAGQLVVID